MLIHDSLCKNKYRYINECMYMYISRQLSTFPEKPEVSRARSDIYIYIHTYSIVDINVVTYKHTYIHTYIQT